GAAEDAPEHAGDPLADPGERLTAHDRREAPDQVIVAAPGALRGGGPRIVLVADGHLAALAIAPRGPRRAHELVRRGVVDRQPWRSVRRPEPQLVGGIGADQPVGAVGYGDGEPRLLDRGDGDRPVGRRDLL